MMYWGRLSWHSIICLGLAVVISACSSDPVSGEIPDENPYNLGEAYGALRKDLHAAGFSEVVAEPGDPLGFCIDGDPAFTDCEAELEQASHFHFYPPASTPENSDYRANPFALQDDLFFLPCLTLLAIDATVPEDEAGYPVNGDYVISLDVLDSEVHLARVARVCGGTVQTSMADLLTLVGEETVTATLTVADSADQTLYKKNITASLDSTVTTQFELLATYELGAIRFQARVRETEDCCGGSATDPSFVSAFVAGYDATERSTRWEWVSPRPSTWTTQAYGRAFRALNDLENGVQMLVGDLSDAAADQVRFSLAKKSESPTQVAVSLLGQVQTDTGTPLFDWSLGKKACVHPTDQTILSDQTVDCELDTVDVAAAPWTAWIAPVRALQSTPTTLAAGLCAPVVSKDLLFSDTDFFTLAWSVCL